MGCGISSIVFSGDGPALRRDGGEFVVVAEGVVEGLLDELGACEGAGFVGDGEVAEDGMEGRGGADGVREGLPSGMSLARREGHGGRGRKLKS